MNQPAIILIVDDVAANRKTLCELLDTRDYRLVEAADGPAALRIAAETPPDLVLLDVMMPHVDGYEVCRRLRADARLAEVPVIMVTALDDQESRLTGIKAGADDFVTKPFNRADLRARVRTITRLNRYRRLVDAQQALRASEARFLQLAEHSDEVFWFATINPERITFVSPAVEKIWGWPAARFYDDTRLWERAIHPDDRPRVHAAYRAVLAGEVARFTEEYRVVRSDGAVLWVLDSRTPIRDASGAIMSVGGVAHDITERKRAAEALRASEERYRLLFGSINDAVGVCGFAADGQPGRFIEVNDIGWKMLGYTREEMLRMSPAEIMGPEGWATFQEVVLPRLKADRHAVWEGAHVHKDGHKIPVEISANVFEFEGNLFAVSTVREISERKQAAQKQRELEAQMR